jgi:hypothetical protein
MAHPKYHVMGEPKGFEVYVNPNDLHGYFEHNEEGDANAGELFFECSGEDSTLTLTDYDGVPSLPVQVCRALVDMGIVVDPEFY